MLTNPLNALQLQQNYSFYTTTQAYMQQQHALAHAQRIQQGGSSSATDRSRTNSFDNPPLTAPIRPEMFMYSVPLQAQSFFAMHTTGFATLPSSPSASTPAEYRRNYRTGQASDAASPTGTLRSQSQPASRTPMPGSQSHGSPGTAAQLNGSTPPLSAQPNANRVPINFFPDENTDSDVDGAASKPVSDCHSSEEENGHYASYYSKGSSSPAKTSATNLSVDIAFGDLGQSGGNVGHGRRRLSTDLPQTVLDKRMRRASSRSPSPLSHSRAFSVGTSTAPLPPGQFLPVAGARPVKENRSPLVVDGSVNKSSSPNLSSLLAGDSGQNGQRGQSAQSAQSAQSGPSVSSRQPSTSESVISEEAASSSFAGSDVLSTSYTSHGLGISGQAIYSDQPLTASPGPQRQATPPLVDTPLHLPVPGRSPLVVDGSTAAVSSPRSQQKANAHASMAAPDTQSFNQRIAAMNGLSPMPYAAIAGNSSTNGTAQLASSTRPRTMTRQQPKGIAPLDLAMPDHSLNAEMQHLSPVYEHRTPSPTVVRRFDSPFGRTSQSADAFPAAAGACITSFASHAKNAKHARKDAGGKGPVKGVPEMPAPRQEALATVTATATATTSTGVAQQTVQRSNGTTGGPGPNGHVRSSKSESGDVVAGGAWQKPKTRKKTGDLKAMANGLVNGEQLPRSESERKGG